MIQWAFDILGIAVTEDERQIKRAYAVLARQYHPEEHPLEWARIHEAYQAAVEYAKTSETALEEIPDVRISEFPRREHRGIQEEQTEIRLDGLGIEEEREAESKRNAEVIENACYESMFQKEQFGWAKEKAEQVWQIQQRLEELAAFRGRRAEKNWRHYFEGESLLNGGMEELYLLLHTVRRKELPGKALEVILQEMEKYEEIYTSREEYNCMKLAEEIIDGCKERIAACRENQRKIGAFSKKDFVEALVICCVVLFLTDFWNEGKAGEIPSAEIAVAASLNAKYETKDYNIDTLSVQGEEISDTDGNEMAFYKVIEERTWEVTAYAIPKQEAEGKIRYMIFDNIQSEEIKQAFEDKLNKRTGCKQGRLFWDSTMYQIFDGVEDGFFQTRYDKNFERFIRQESEVRKEVPRSLTAYLAPDSDAVNGICEYYIPGPVLQIEDKLYEDKPFEDEFRSEIARISNELEQCAVDYHIQIRGITLPDYMFEGSLEQAETGGAAIEELRDKAYESGYVFGTYPSGDAHDEDYQKNNVASGAFR